MPRCARLIVAVDIIVGLGRRDEKDHPVAIHSGLENLYCLCRHSLTSSNILLSKPCPYGKKSSSFSPLTISLLLSTQHTMCVKTKCRGRYKTFNIILPMASLARQIFPVRPTRPHDCKIGLGFTGVDLGLECPSPSGTQVVREYQRICCTNIISM